MPDFPVTVNGVTWDSPDFSGTKYHRNLFNFLDDVYTDACKTTNCYVTTSLTISGTDKSITLPSVKPYVVGQRLRIVPATDANTSNYSLGYMEGFVVSYNTGTGVLVFRPLVYHGSATVAMWHISPGGEPVVSTAPVTLAQGGLGDVGELAYPYLGLEQIAETAAFFEDFTGSFGANLLRESQGVGFVTATTGSGRVYFQGNTKAAESISYAAQALNGDHPGIAVLEVGEAASTAEINLGSCSAVLNNGGMYRVMFLLDYSNSRSNASYMQIGLRTYTGTEFEPGAMIEYPRADGSDAVCSVFDYATHQSTLPLESGVWYEIRIYCLTGGSSDEIEAKLYRINQYSVDLVYTFPQYAWLLPTAANAIMPFIRLKKLYGSRIASRLWVDYLHFNPTISR